MAAAANPMVTRVLVLDENLDHVNELVKIMAFYGCDCRGTPDVAETGLTAFREFSPHLVFVQCSAKGMPAWRFAFDARAIKLAFRPYMVALADKPSRRHRALCNECGFDEFEPKPIFASQLRDWLSKAEKSIKEQEAAGESWDR